jgi:putative flavoprotein involved in K+ transport
MPEGRTDGRGMSKEDLCMDVVDTVVVGAGQAGLAVSALLSQRDIAHLVLERGQVGESWRSQRWDSFVLNTPNWSNQLPGAGMAERGPDGFAGRDELVEFLERFVGSLELPIREHTEVSGVRRLPDGEFLVDTPGGQVQARNVVVCSGSMSMPRVPAMAAELDERISSLTAATYRNADALAPGAVVVVGSGQSGCQIVEDLLAAGRTVHLCVSKVGRIPRRYRGRDIVAWWKDMGFLDVAVGDLPDPEAQYAAQPQVSGVGGGHTISLQSLARDGAFLLGRVERIEGVLWHLRPDVDECVQFADAKCAEFKAAIDAYIEDHGVAAPEPELDPYEPPMPDLHGSDQLQQFDLAAEGVSTVIWCVGFRGDFSWIHDDVLGDRGLPIHDAGVSAVKGLYFVGFPWLSKRKSGILFGVSEDARRIVDKIAASP